MAHSVYRIFFASLLIVSITGCTQKSQRRAAAAKAAAQTKTAAEVTPIETKVVTLPAGTRFSVRVPDAIPANIAEEAKIEGELAAPISAAGGTVAPRGTKVLAVVASAHPVSVRVTQFRFKDGKTMDVTSDEPQVPVSGREASMTSAAIPAESLIGFRLKEPVQVTVRY